MSSRRFPPQLPAHPGRKQDDSVRQVSWLPGLRLLPPSRRLSASVAFGSILAGYSCGGSRFRVPET